MFQPGDRVLYVTSATGLESASIGLGDYLFVLNDQPTVSATVLSVEDRGEGGLKVAIRPDGWPLPFGVYPAGFWIDEARLVNHIELREFPGRVADYFGQPVDEAHVRALVMDLLRKGRGDRFDRPRWEILQEYEGDHAKKG